METTSEQLSIARALATAYSLNNAVGHGRSSHGCNKKPLPPPSKSRLDASLCDAPYNVDHFSKHAASQDGTVLYLAYGSNLSIETFRGKRGIKPLSQINVQVPRLRLTFDLPGIPYTEPCFANSGLRDPERDVPDEPPLLEMDEKSGLLDSRPQRNEYHKIQWHKGLIGVVYEVTPEDYAHIIATEGGGSSYQDIVVDCHPFVSSDPNTPVPQNPTSTPFKAHTLFAPAVPPGDGLPKDGRGLSRPDPDYAQSSPRYLKLVTDGAAELYLPYEYQDYLHSLRPYRITTIRQRMGQALIAATWLPIIGILFGLSKLLVGEGGKQPKWMRVLFTAVFAGIWATYDNVYKPAFGDGERTVGDEAKDAYGRNHPSQTAKSLSALGRSDTYTDIEKIAVV